MSAASPSAEPMKVGANRFPWIAPITTFVLAGASQAIVSFELNRWALMLLLGCGALGVLLRFIPESAQAWDPLPDSSQATLKQTVAIARVLVYIGLIALPGTIFMTSKPVREMLPPQIDKYISSQVDTLKKSEDLFVFLPKELDDVRPSLYVGKFVPRVEKVSETNGAGGGGIKISPPPRIKGELYVLQTSQIVKSIFEDALLPMIYLVASCLVVVLALFVGAIFFMELVGGIMWEQRAR
jgi:hypothetical protein